MKLAIVPAALALLLVTSVPAAEDDGRVFELRTYYANEGSSMLCTRDFATTLVIFSRNMECRMWDIGFR